MTPKQVLDYYKSPHYFSMETRMSDVSLYNWIKWGRIPLPSQVKIHKLTNGELKAELPSDLVVGDSDDH